MIRFKVIDCPPYYTLAINNTTVGLGQLDAVELRELARLLREAAKVIDPIDRTDYYAEVNDG